MGTDVGFALGDRWPFKGASKDRPERLVGGGRGQGGVERRLIRGNLKAP